MEQISCVYIDKFVDLDQLLEIIKSSQEIKCGGCKKGVHVERRSEGKIWFPSSSPHAKKAIWVCVECGDYICGGVGLPTEAQSHVMQHFRLTRHRLAIQCDNPKLLYCFRCDSYVCFEEKENGERKDLLMEAVKLIKDGSSKTCSPSAETEEGSCSVSSGLEARDGCAVRGLVNFGNTCFFNSVLQNLLSLDQLRDHYLFKEDLSIGGGGPLVTSLKRLFAETKSEAGLFKRVMNPKALFVSVCAKAPQFRGFQQHDSHELLRCLLDGLHTEESSLRKELCVSDTDGDTSSHDQKPTLVDSVFGGEISSTVSCLQCGHSSIVFEPFLDLSLPVPSKKRTSPPKNWAEDSKDSEKFSAMALDNKQVPETATQPDIELETSPSNNAGGVDKTFVGNTETLMHDNDGNAKPETVPDKQCARATQSSKDTAASGHREETVDYVDFSSFFDEPAVSCDGQTVAEGDGDGEAPSSSVSSFFDEPEISKGPVFGPPSKPEVSEASCIAVSSESDPELVLDDSDSPVSVDRCLALFTKPEILSEDNAWHCENCSKNLKLQRLRETKEGFGNGWVNENGASLAFDDPRYNPLNQFCIDLENVYKEITISSQPANGNESEKREDEAVDSEEVIVKRAATKRVLVNKAPPVLTVHLKRFSQDARGRLSKLSGHVEFKEFIDLGQYMDSRCTEEDQPVYRLAGLVEHSGTLGRGHYVAYIRGGHKERKNSDVKEPDSSIGYHASDSFVRRASFEEVLRSEAYILFYQRI